MFVVNGPLVRILLSAPAMVTTTTKGRLESVHVALQRPLARRLCQALTALGAVLLTAAPLQAATINVGSSCSLQNAIHAANSDSAVGGCSAGSGADTILMPRNAHVVLTAPDNDWHYGTGLPVVTSTITIEGNGSTIERDVSAEEFRIFGVEFSGDLTLRDATVSGGAGMDNIGYGFGSAVQTYYATTTIEDCMITGNSDVAIGDRGSGVTIQGTTIAGNLGSGVISVFGGTLIDRSAIFDNDGAGVYAAYHNLTVSNTTVSGNNGLGIGGEFFEVVSSTITGNADVGVYGALYSMELFQNLIAGNAAGEAYLSPAWGYNYATTSGNLFGHSGVSGIVGFTPDASDITPSDALNAIIDPALAFNGGATMTHLLRATSPAKDAGVSCMTSVDQRGVTRPRGLACDIGAVELVPDPCPSASATSGCTVNGVAGRPCSGTSGNDVILGTSGNDVILGRGGNDTITSAGGNDVVCGGDGNDSIHGGNGDDQVVGGNGDDALWGDTGADSINGGTGVDACTTSSNDVSIVTCN